MKFLITIIEIKIKEIDTCANLKAIKSKIEEHIIFGIQKIYLRILSKWRNIKVEQIVEIFLSKFKHQNVHIFAIDWKKNNIEIRNSTCHRTEKYFYFQTS